MGRAGEGSEREEHRPGSLLFDFNGPEDVRASSWRAPLALAWSAGEEESSGVREQEERWNRENEER
jgi:hypothetical protein